MFIYKSSPFKCPRCGTNGKLWKKNPDIFICPNCSTIYSNYGTVLEPEEEPLIVWN